MGSYLSSLSGIARAIASAAPAIAMLAMVALIVGGVRLIQRGQRQKGVLMIVCAVVVLANVLIWTL